MLLKRQTELWLALALTLVAFSVRVHRVGEYSLSEDETAKWQAIQEYRQGHFAGVNGEHPLLMKLCAWGSLSAGERWNRFAVKQSWPVITPEAALRMPNIVFGAASTFALFLLSRALMGPVGAFAAAAFWALTPLPIALNRLLKEETPLVLFTLLGSYFYLRAAQSKEPTEKQRYMDLSAVGFGFSLASKYALQLFGLNQLAWYDAGRHGLDPQPVGRRLPRFFVLMAVTFLLVNPVVLAPTNFASILHWLQAGGAHHTGYNLAGTLYVNSPSFGHGDMPSYFYAWLLLVKTPIPVLAAIVAGGLFLLRRRDSLASAFFLSFGVVQLLWLSAFPAKWIRYVLGVLPFLFLAGGYAVQQLYDWLSSREWPAAGTRLAPRAFALAAALSLVCAQSELKFWDPYFSLYLNGLGGGANKVAQYFTPDEISELDSRQTAELVSQSAPWGARLATSKPMSMGYYLARDGRADIQVVALYDPSYRIKLGDLVLREESRRYFETDDLLQWLPVSQMPHVDVPVGPVMATSVYGIRVTSANQEAAVLQPRLRPVSIAQKELMQ